MNLVAINRAEVELYELVGAIDCGREVPSLKNNASFEAFKEQERLQEPGSPRVFFGHKQNILRWLVDQDSFEDLPNVIEVPNNEDLVVVSFARGEACGGGGSRGSGCFWRCLRFGLPRWLRWLRWFGRCRWFWWRVKLKLSRLFVGSSRILERLFRFDDLTAGFIVLCWGFFVIGVPPNVVGAPLVSV